MEILVEIRTQQMINQAFRMLTQKCNNLDIFTSVVQSYLQKFCDEGKVTTHCNSDSLDGLLI